VNSTQPRQPRSIWSSLPLALLALAVLLYAAYFSFLTIVRYQAFESRALDMGNLHQAIWNTAHGNWFRLTNQEVGVTSRLSLHVEPILLLIAPLYRLLPAVETLLVLQAVIVALGALPLFALARRRRLGDWVGLVFAVAFLLNPSIQAANWLEFHPVTLAPTFLMAAFYFLVAGRTRWFALFAVLAVACKEEIGLLVFMFGLYAFFALHRRRVGTVTMVLAAGWSLVAVLGIQSYFAGGNIHWGRYAYLGETTAAKLVSLFTQPGLVVAHLQQANVARYFFELLLPVGFTALLAPEVLLLALPSLAINLLADFAPMHEVTTLIYAAPIVAFVMVATVMGVARVRDWVVRRSARPENPRSGAQFAVLWGCAILVLGGALLSQRLYGYLPGSGHYQALRVTDHHARIQAILDQIPPDAKVSAQDRLNPHVAGRETVYIFPRVDDADTVLIDVTGSAWPQHPNDLKRTVDELLASDFGIATAADGVLLLSKSAATDEIPPSFYTAWQTNSSQSALAQRIPVDVNFGGEVQLLDYAVTTDRNGELVVSTTWQALSPLDHDLRFDIALLDPELAVLHDSQFYQPTAALWYPASMWATGEPVRIETLPWTLDADRFVLAVAVYPGKDGWAQGSRLPVQAVTPTMPILDGDTLVRLGGYAHTSGNEWVALSPQPAAAERPLDVQFGDSLRLDGVSIQATSAPGRSLPITLDWRGIGAPAVDYTSFVHLLDSTGAKVAQLDWTPHDAISKLPTSNWPPGWVGQDTQSLALPAELAPGEYTLIAGLYDWQTGSRLPVTGADAAPGDVAEIGTLRIEP